MFNRVYLVRLNFTAKIQISKLNLTRTMILLLTALCFSSLNWTSYRFTLIYLGLIKKEFIEHKIKLMFVKIV